MLEDLKQRKYKYMCCESCITVCTTVCSWSSCDWSFLVSSHLLICLPVPKLPTAPPLTCSWVTSSWRPVMASLTTCRTTWFYESFKNSRCRFKNSDFSFFFHTLLAERRVILLVCVCSFQAPSYDSVLQTAQSIAQQAHDLAYDPNYMSPFAQFACDNGLNVRGTCTDSPVKTIESIQVFMNSSSGTKIRLEMDLFIFLFFFGIA